MKYFHRTHLPPDQVLAGAGRYFDRTLRSVEEQPRRRQFAGTIGRITGLTPDAGAGGVTSHGH